MFELDAEFWVALAFVVFIGVLIYFGAHGMMIKGIDGRRDRIKGELDEALQLREEAQALLAQYQRRQREAVQEAAQIVAGATAEAERMMAEAKAKTEEFIARRSKMAEAKIAQAEAQAVVDVRAAATEAAVAAAEKVLGQMVKGEVARGLIVKAIDDVKSKLN